MMDKAFKRVKQDIVTNLGSENARRFHRIPLNLITVPSFCVSVPQNASSYNFYRHSLTLKVPRFADGKSVLVKMGAILPWRCFKC